MREPPAKFEPLRCFIWGIRGWPVVGWTRGHGGMVAGSLSTQRPLQTLAHPHQQTRCPALCCHEGWWSKDKNILLSGLKITTKYQNNSHHIFLNNFNKLEYSPHFISGTLPLHGTICLYSEPDIVSHRRVWIPGTLMSPGTKNISESRTNTIAKIKMSQCEGSTNKKGFMRVHISMAVALRLLKKKIVVSFLRRTIFYHAGSL